MVDIKKIKVGQTIGQEVMGYLVDTEVTLERIKYILDFPEAFEYMPITYETIENQKYMKISQQDFEIFRIEMEMPESDNEENKHDIIAFIANKLRESSKTYIDVAFKDKKLYGCLLAMFHPIEGRPHAIYFNNMKYINELQDLYSLYSGKDLKLKF